ncbi:MAG TPA: 3-phosphoshikimate 1-carboxyvinyltransferase, partial [Lachnospiraceae bacterium]|nr:3-phosphoshikimate 1-carboxyvinyltransferase [Lachnospiraceae bacterium]
SSAAYFIAAGLIVPGSEILVKNVGINPTRAGILEVARDMGGQIEVIREYDRGGEKAADLLVKSSSLHGTTIEGALIPTLIDEIPVIAVMAAYAEGTTVIRDAAELKVKESDRIATMTENLKAMGADIAPEEDGMVIRGTGSLHGASVRSFMDHRVAMSMAVAALAAEGTTTIEDADCVLISYPSFYEDLEKLI